MPPKRSASRLLQLMLRHSKADVITLKEMKESLHERGFGILLVIFVIPCCLPVPVPPGVPLIFSIPLLFLSAQMILGLKNPWLPGWLATKSFKRASIAYMIQKSAPILRKIEKVLRPRLSFASTRSGERVVGLVVFLLAFVIALPLPLPFSNFLPGIGILVMSLGLLNRDGLVILLGMLIGVLGAGFVIAALLLGIKVANGFIEKIFF